MRRIFIVIFLILTIAYPVNALELTDAQRAQIEDIVKRKAGIPAENIIISTVVE